jgi:ankyrin repeat protein
MDNRKMTLEELQKKVREKNAVQEALNSNIQKGEAENVEGLLKDVEPTPDVNLPDKNNGNKTPLMLAAGQGHNGIVKMLLDAKADVNTTTNPNPEDKRGITALGLAAIHDKAEIVQMLIDAKANLEVKDIDGNTALLEAASRGKSQAVKTLLEAKADVSTTNNKEQSLQDVTKNEDIKKLISKFFKQANPAQPPIPGLAQPRSNIDDGCSLM